MSRRRNPEKERGNERAKYKRKNQKRKKESSGE